MDDYFYLSSKEETYNDINYRYKIKLPKISYLVNKGTKITLLENSKYISEKIGINDDIFGGYISNKLSCRLIKLDEKKCIAFNGSFEEDVIIKLLKDFIKIYVLCSICDYPEIEFDLENNKLCKKCKSCGNLEEIDKKYIDKTYNAIVKNMK